MMDSRGKELIGIGREFSRIFNSKLCKDLSDLMGMGLT